MSTVPEAIAAGHAGMDVLGFTLVSNMAAGILDRPLSEREVLDPPRSRATNFPGSSRPAWNVCRGLSMDTLFSGVTAVMTDEDCGILENAYVLVSEGIISSVSPTRPASFSGREIDGRAGCSSPRSQTPTRTCP
jgi:hypothetical protein